MPPSRRKLFEELGLLNEPEMPNPLDVLGISHELARGLLDEDNSGEALRVVTGGMHRLLSRRYHPDVGATANPEKFGEIDAANRRLEQAPPAALIRWVNAGRPPASSQNTRLKAQYEQLMGQSAELLQEDMRLGHHPMHYSQIGWTQGMLARRGGSTLLMRRPTYGGLEVRQGRSAAEQNMVPDTATSSKNVFDFAAFLLRHDSFGIEPGTKIATYIDESGRGSILGQDLTFLMDITDPINEYREQQKQAPHSVLRETGSSDAWARAADPVLCTTTIPASGTRRENAQVNMMRFPDWTGPEKGGLDLVWTVPMEVAGTISDEAYFKRMRHSAAVGASAITGAETKQQLNYFDMMATSTHQLIEKNAGYSPLLAPGNVLVLMDEASRSPIVTDTTVIGLIGSNAKAP